MTIRCLVVDDDHDILLGLKAYLEGYGFEVATAGEATEARRRLGAGPRPDIVVLDLMLPGESGLSLCQWIQAQHGLPVVMLTARGDPASRVVGLELGADDYLPKPFEPRELVARLHAVLRRSRGGAADEAGPGRAGGRRLRFAGWTLDTVLRQLSAADGLVVPLSNAEHRLLSAFLERPGRVLSREQLIEASRAPGVEVNDRSIDLGVSRLRQKLGDPPREPRLILTVRGEGYAFNAEVQR